MKRTTRRGSTSPSVRPAPTPLPRQSLILPSIYLRLQRVRPVPLPPPSRPFPHARNRPSASQALRRRCRKHEDLDTAIRETTGQMDQVKAVAGGEEARDGWGGDGRFARCVRYVSVLLSSCRLELILCLRSDLSRWNETVRDQAVNLLNSAFPSSFFPCSGSSRPFSQNSSTTFLSLTPPPSLRPPLSISPSRSPSRPSSFAPPSSLSR